MTGNANAATLRNFMYAAFALQYIKLETPSEDVLNSDPSYYAYAFYRCEKLQTIDCELDFTGQTDTVNMFTNCYYLKNLRIKPFTLSCSLNVGACRYFTYPEVRDNSLLAILNALPNDKEKNKDITITYSNEAWSFGTGDNMFPVEFISKTVYFTSDIDSKTQEELGLYTWDRQTETSVETTLFDAFVYEKGVTLAR